MLRNRHTKSSNHDPKAIWEKIWYDQNGQLVLWQRPNAVLIGWAVATLISLFVPLGLTENIFYWLSEVLLGVWALLEIWKGVNYFRKALGVIILVMVIFSSLNIL